MKGRAIQPPVYWLFPGKQSWWFCLRKQQYICGGESPGGGLPAGETRPETLEKVAEPSGKGQRRLKVKVRTGVWFTKETGMDGEEPNPRRGSEQGTPIYLFLFSSSCFRTDLTRRIRYYLAVMFSGFHSHLGIFSWEPPDLLGRGGAGAPH